MQPSGISSPPSSQPDPVQERIKLEGRAQRGASWFFWVAALSAINSIISIAGGDRVFIFGLGVTQVVDAFAAAFGEELGLGRGSWLGIVALGLSLLVAGLIALIGYLARKGNQVVFLLGIALYLLDGLLVGVLEDWFGLLFHIVVLIYLVMGFRALRKLAESPPLPSGGLA
ncbi:MAG: hypothetical protein ACRDG5_05800 [Anaerolineales bacterium]